MMKNLFFVHTPIQMVIAQQLIHQEKLEQNVLLYGYIDNNKHFVDIFDLLKIDELWSKSILFENLPACVDLTLKRPFSCFIDIIKNVKRLDAIISANDIGSIYFGDIDNIGYQFLMFYYRDKLQVNVFEEGTSHYLYKNKKPYTRRFQRTQEKIIDLLFYKPIFHLSFANYWFRDGDYSLLPMDCRYSIIPGYYNEPYDKLLKISPYFQSPKLLEFLHHEISFIKELKCIFLITSVIYEHKDMTYRRQRYSAYLEAIYNYSLSIPRDSIIVLKLHPREDEIVANDIISIFKRKGIDVIVLSKQINIPVELYLQLLKPSKIVAFYNSSTMYNGYLYPKCEIKDLIFDFFKICNVNGYNIDDLKSFYKDIF